MPTAPSRSAASSSATSSYRADQMPYGGAEQSGVGREGVRYAMDDYTYERVLVLTGLAL